MSTREPFAFALRRSGLRWALGLALVAALAGHALGRYDIRFADTLDALIYDAKVRLFMPRTADTRIAILDIDEKSLAELGRWPWNRARMAELIDALFTREHVAVLGFDMVFAEPDASSGLAVLDDLAHGALAGDDAYRRALDALTPRLDYDRRFADALAGRPSCSAITFRTERRRAAQSARRFFRTARSARIRSRSSTGPVTAATCPRCKRRRDARATSTR